MGEVDELVVRWCWRRSGERGGDRPPLRSVFKGESHQLQAGKFLEQEISPPPDQGVDVTPPAFTVVSLRP